MQRVHTILFASILFVFAALAPTSARASDWTGNDWVFGSLSAGAGGVGFGLAGGLAGSLLDGPCRDPSHDCTPAWMIAGAGAGLIVGSGAGVSFYGKKRGFDGNMGIAVLGALIGNLAAGPVIAFTAMTIDNGAIGFPIVIAALIAGPAIGATFAYKLSIGHGGDGDVRTTAAMLEVTPDRLKLRAPIVGWAVTANDAAVMVPLAGGRF